MKNVICLSLLIVIVESVFSQAKLCDGIYLIDQSKNKNVASQSNKAVIQFNPLFVKEGPDEYDPITIFTDDFVPFELTSAPVIQTQKNHENFLVVELTSNATKRLTAFTLKNIMNNIVMVVNGQALSIYKVVHPVISSEIKIIKCSSNNGCNEVYKRLLVRMKDDSVRQVQPK